MEIENNFTFNIKRFDLSDQPITETAQLSFNPDGDENELLEQLKAALKLQESSQNIIKLRLEDDTLIPLSALLAENQDRSFNVEVTRIHQNLPAQNRSHLHAVYLEAVKSKIQTMDKRLNKMESLIPQMRVKREMQNERAICTLSTKVAFLERRLDQLTPEEWKSQI